MVDLSTIGAGVASAEEVTPLVLQLFETAIKAVAIVRADTGKPLPVVFQDVINTLTPGQPNAKALN
jgi:hypothetical protein